MVRVVDEPMAFYLAELLNALDRGEPLPPPGAQHHPVRFQLQHDATGLTQDVGVVYVHESSARVVAHAPSDELAESVSRLLRHVDYPMVDYPSRLTSMAQPGRIKAPPGPLPQATLVPEKGERRTLGLAGYVLVSVLPLAVALALVASFAWPFVVAVVLVYVLLGVGLWLRSRA